MAKYYVKYEAKIGTAYAISGCELEAEHVDEAQKEKWAKFISDKLFELNKSKIDWVKIMGFKER